MQNAAGGAWSILLWLVGALTVLPSLLSWQIAWSYSRIPRTYAAVEKIEKRGESLRDESECPDGGLASITMDGDAVVILSGRAPVRISTHGAHAIACGPSNAVALGMDDGSIWMPLRSQTLARFREATVEGLVFEGTHLLAALGRRDELAIIDTVTGELIQRRPLRGEAGRLKRSVRGPTYMSDMGAGRVWRLARDGSDELIVLRSEDDQIVPGIRLAASDGTRLHLQTSEERVILRIPGSSD